MNSKNKPYFQNRFHPFYFFCFLFIFIFWPVGSHAIQDKLKIFTVNYPLQYFAEKIAGTHAIVIFPAPAGVDPAYWMPDKKTIANYQQADLILLNGAHYAKWVSKVSLPASKMVDTSRKFKDQYIYSINTTTHSHGPEGAHAHESLAFTTWLDFSFAVEHARAIKKALTKKRPEFSDLFNQNFLALEREILELDNLLKVAVSKKPDLLLIVSHPVYDYMTRKYAMNIKSVHWEPDETPNHAQWIELQSILKHHPAKWMIWEGAPDSKNVNDLRAFGLESVVVSPCAARPEKYDFMAVMKQNIENIKKIYD